MNQRVDRILSGVDKILGWGVVVVIVLIIAYWKSDNKPAGPTLEYRILSANVNGRLYTKEAGPNDYASQYVGMPAADGSGETVLLPWSVIKVTKQKVRASEIVDAVMFYNKMVQEMRARNDPLLEEALRVQSQWAASLTPEQANAIYQELLRRQQLPRP